MALQKDITIFGTQITVDDAYHKVREFHLVVADNGELDISVLIRVHKDAAASAANEPKIHEQGYALSAIGYETEVDELRGLLYGMIHGQIPYYEDAIEV